MVIGSDTDAINTLSCLHLSDLLDDNTCSSLYLLLHSTQSSLSVFIPLFRIQWGFEISHEQFGYFSNMSCHVSFLGVADPQRIHAPYVRSAIVFASRLSSSLSRSSLYMILRLSFFSASFDFFRLPTSSHGCPCLSVPTSFLCRILLLASPIVRLTYHCSHKCVALSPVKYSFPWTRLA